MQQFINFPIFEEYVRPHPAARPQVGLFGLLFFGTGLALILTQVFAESYGARIAGIAFVGTLAALYIFMLIARSTVFATEIDYDLSIFYPRDLRLSVDCGRENFQTNLASAKRPIMTVSADPDQVLEIRKAALDYEERHIRPSNAPPILMDSDVRAVKFGHVGEPDRDIILSPIRNNGRTIVFFIPHVLLTTDDELSLFLAGEQTLVQSGGTRNVQNAEVVRVFTLLVDRQAPTERGVHRPVIQASINLTGVRDACG